jgi:hypothetical protein
MRGSIFHLSASNQASFPSFTPASPPSWKRRSRRRRRSLLHRPSPSKSSHWQCASWAQEREVADRPSDKVECADRCTAIQVVCLPWDRRLSWPRPVPVTRSTPLHDLTCTNTAFTKPTLLTQCRCCEPPLPAIAKRQCCYRWRHQQ